MREPLSVISSMAYVIAGAHLVLTNSECLALYVGLTLVLLGATSAWYHWARSSEASLADERGIYVAFTSLIATAYAPLCVGPYDLAILVAVCMAFGAALAVNADREIVDAGPVTALLACIMIAGVGVSLDIATAAWLFAGYTGTVLIKEAPNRSAKMRPYRDLLHSVWHLGTASFMYVTASLVLS